MNIYALSIVAIYLIMIGAGVTYRLVRGFRVEWWIAGLGTLLGSVVGIWFLTLSVNAKTTDVEIWNGQVESKSRDKVSCRHDYKCRCRQVCSGTGKDKSCHEECDTCYEHGYDIDSNLRTTLGTIRIENEDRQGLVTPPRWARAAIGDPVAKAHTYENLVRGSEQSLFKTNSEIVARYAKALPVYPKSVYDYHYLDRVIPSGVVIPEIYHWNRGVSNILRALGPKKQANIVIVVSGSASQDFADALNASWQGGKKNDIIIVIGAPSYPTISWVRVLGWTKAEIFNVRLRDAIQEIGTMNRDEILKTIELETYKNFERRSMKDFEYLRSEISPDTEFLVGIFIWVFLTAFYGGLVIASNELDPRAAYRYMFGSPRRRF